MENKNPLVIYHANCTDGFTAAWIANNALNGECEFHPAQYGTAPPEISRDVSRDIYILDFCYPREIVIDLAVKTALPNGNKLVILDHHKTAEAELHELGVPKNTTIVFDMSKSGAMLTWEYFYPDEEPCELVKYVQDRDLWKWELPHSKAISAYIASLPMTFEQWDDFHTMFVLGLNQAPFVYDRMVDCGVSILRFQQQCVDRAVANAMEVTIGEHTVKAVNVAESSLISEIGGKLAEGKPFGATFFVTKDQVIWSLRSREGGVDVAEIAKRFGGGGHRNAAGFKMKLDKENQFKNLA